MMRKHPVLTVIVSIPFVLLISLLLSSLVNLYAASRFTEQLYQCPLPDRTTRLEGFSYRDTFNVKDNDLRYNVSLWVSSDLPYDEIHQFYSDINFQPLFPWQMNSVDLHIMDLESGCVDFDQIPQQESYAKTEFTGANRRERYVYTVDLSARGGPAYFDLFYVIFYLVNY